MYNNSSKFEKIRLKSDDACGVQSLNFPERKQNPNGFLDKLYERSLRSMCVVNDTLRPGFSLITKLYITSTSSKILQSLQSSFENE